ncbi:MAG: hypothetical protein GXO40_06235 [Epsilonproteobacteria bacterium]|nr:hypothetical protein [Campylobacterota bacterium]
MTILEVLISIILLTLVISTISQLKFYKNIHFDKKEDYLIKTIYKDVMNASFIQIKKDDKTYTLFLKTSNSLYNNIYPYIRWMIDDDYISRIECIKPSSKECFIDRFVKVGKFEVSKRGGILHFVIDKKIFEIQNFKEQKW